MNGPRCRFGAGSSDRCPAVATHTSFKGPPRFCSDHYAFLLNVRASLKATATSRPPGGSKVRKRRQSAEEKYQEALELAAAGVE